LTIWGSILKANGIAVYLCLVRHANNDGTCYPSINTIAKKCGICRRTAISTINQLNELGHIKREGRNKQGSREKTSNLYTTVDLSKVIRKEVVQEMQW
jgi:predicted transcriptional regulator